MTLPTSGTLTLGMIQTEFSAPGGTGLTDFYRGGTYVPNSSANANVPTSGTISILDFYGASKASPSLTVTASPTSASGSAEVITIPLDGVIVTTNSVTVTASGGTGTGYTYSWSRISGSVLIGVSSSTANTVTWSADMSAYGTISGIWSCTVTDSAGNTGSVSVNASTTLSQ